MPSPTKFSPENYIQMEKKSIYLNENYPNDQSPNENILSNQRVHDLLQSIFI